MPADTPFDPCKQWLGFDAVHLGNHRLVLGLSPGADEGAVRRAADARIRLLESISPGPFELARNSLIKRIEESRDAVLAELVTSAAPGSTAGFAMPRPPSQLAAGSPPPSPDPWHPPAQVPGAAPPVPAAVAGQEQIVVRSTRYRKRTPFAGIAVTILALSVAVAALYWFKTNKHLLEKGKPAGRERVVARAEPEAPKPPPQRVPKKPADEGPVDPTSDRAVSTGGRVPQRTPRPSAPSADDEPVEPLGTKPPASMTGKDPASPQKKPSESMDDEKPARMVKPSEPKPDTKPGADSDDKPDAKPGMKPDSEPKSGTKPDGKPPTKEAMKEEMKDEPAPGDESAPAPPDTEKLDAALKKVFALLQQQEHDAVENGLEAVGEEYADKASRKRVNAWKQLAAYAKGYSGYRDEALETVAAGDEYEYKKQKISIVEADRKVFKFRVSGETKTFARDKIPSGIVLAIVTRWFDDNPANDLYLGAHHLAKPEPDLERAREHWEKADARGADASGLFPLLDDPVIGGAADAGDEAGK